LTGASKVSQKIAVLEEKEGELQKKMPCRNCRAFFIGLIVV